jgi:multidrug resistance protein, MATE family
MMTTTSASSSAPSPTAAPKTFPILGEARALLHLGLPIMLIALVNMGMSVTDTLMVSAAFGAEALAAVAVGSDFYSILFYLGAGTIGGLAPFYTAAVVKADPVERARLERAGRVVVVLIAALLVPIVWTAPDWLGRLGLEKVLLDEGRGYTRSMALTLLPMLGVMLYRTILTAAERPKVFLKVTAAMLPLNALGNLVFMHGLGPIPPSGPTGAGISTLVVALATLGVLVVIARLAGVTPMPVPPLAAVRRRDLQSILRVGVPIGIMMAAELGIFLAATLYAATLSAADVAAHTLTLRVAGVAYAVPAALLQATMVRMARAEVAGDPALRRSVTLGALGLSGVAGAGLCLLLSGLATPLSNGVFDATPAGLTAAGVAAGLLRGRKDTRAPMVFTLTGYWAVGAPLGLWLCEARDQGIMGLWIGLAVGTTVTTMMMLVRLAVARTAVLEQRRTSRIRA